MTKAGFQVKLRRYLAENYAEIEHPADPYSASRALVLQDVDTTVDALLALLQLPADIPDAKNIAHRVLASFELYLDASHLETQRRINAVSSLALRIEPFLKKLFAMRHPDVRMPKGLRSLIQTDMLGYQGGFPARARQDEEFLRYLNRLRPDEAVVLDAYCFRNVEAHEAKRLKPAEEQRYWRSVVATYMLIAVTNMDLVPAIRERVLYVLLEFSRV